MNIKPLGKNVLVEPIKKEEGTSSGIVLPDKEEKSNPQIGKVVAIGEDKDIYPEIKKGVFVIFRQFSGDKVLVEDQEYIILNFKKDIVAIME
jgi:chaperonin GroES